MVLFTNNRKIGSFYNPRLFGTELRMTDQVKWLRVISSRVISSRVISSPAILSHPFRRGLFRRGVILSRTVKTCESHF
jgi:hypothetical protein